MKLDLGQYILSRNADLAAERARWESTWQELADYFLPRKASIANKSASTGTERTERIFDSTAMQAASVLANGQLSYITPADARWFVFEPPQALRGNDDAAQWYQSCTEVAQFVLATSNFYSEIHEAYYDDGVFGTYCIHVRRGDSHPVVFTKLDVGSYCLAEDAEGIIDTLYREIEMTLDQAVAEFGEDNLAPTMQKKLQEYRTSGKGGSTRYTFIHAIYPRPLKERDVKKADGKNKPWASIYVDKSNKHVCRESGFDEKPFFAGRHIKASAGVYGVSPSWNALPDARQLNFLVKQLDALAEIKAFPRLLIPSTHEGEIDLRAGGGTYVDVSNPAAIPREWATAGEYAIGIDRENRKADSINRAMHVDMFRMFAEISKTMTATEVSERAAEKIAQFSPAFARKTTELLTPMLRAVFGILLRNGYFQPPPQSAAIMEDGSPVIALPDITYVSRVALAIRSAQNVALMRTLGQVGPIAQMQPDIMDNYDTDVIAREIGRNNGLPARWIRPTRDRDELRQSRAVTQQQAQQMQQMQQAADAIGKAGSVKEDSAIAQMIAQQQPA